MSPKQLQQYDLFLDENDWDIYYWATQQPTPTSMAYAEGAGPGLAAPEAQGEASKETDEWRQGKPVPAEPTKPSSGEWAQTVGTFKPAYRPVPARWKNSEVLSMLRKHVKDRSAGGVHEEISLNVDGKESTQSTKNVNSGSGLGFMPELKMFDQ